MADGTLRALLVGAGGLARSVWARTVQEYEETELAGWIDILPGAAEAAAAEQELDDIYVGTDLHAAVEAVRPDFVIDVTVPSAHREVVVRSLEAGLPVLGEKPMTDSMESAREMVAASERTGKLYMVSQSRRYDRNLIALRRLITEATGPLGILNSDFYIGAHFGESRHGLQHPLLLDMGVHIFDAARYLSGEDPVAVYCEEWEPSWSWYRGGSTASAVFEMTEGLRYTFRGSWCSEGRHTSWESEWRAVGPHGTATWDGVGTPVAEVVVGPGDFVSQFETRVGDPPEDPHQYFAGSLRDFVHALRTGETPHGECHDNMKTLAMALGAIDSATTGRRVPIEV